MSSAHDKKEAADDANRWLLPIQMQYAWNWFQYHADQRLKAFNYFVLLLGALLVAYGTAMKEYHAAAIDGAKSESKIESDEQVANSRTPTELEVQALLKQTRSYSNFAAAVAACGFVISIAFFCIEVRNAELVECGRVWLDELEKDVHIKPREDDNQRVHLGKALGFWNTKNNAAASQKLGDPPEIVKDNAGKTEESGNSKAGTNLESRQRWYEKIFIHKLWIRIIYISAALGFAAAANWSYRGFS